MHNTDKSDDDELLRFYLISFSAHNDIADQLLKDKVHPSWQRRVSVLLTCLKGMRLHGGNADPTLPLSKENYPPYITYEIDEKRLNSSLFSITRGLYYYEHKFREKLFEELKPLGTDGEFRSECMKMGFYTETWPGGRKLALVNRGANPRIFQYNFDYSPEGYGLCRLQFYEGATAHICWRQHT